VREFQLSVVNSKLLVISW